MKLKDTPFFVLVAQAEMTALFDSVIIFRCEKYVLKTMRRVMPKRQFYRMRGKLRNKRFVEIYKREFERVVKEIKEQIEKERAEEANQTVGSNS